MKSGALPLTEMLAAVVDYTAAELAACKIGLFGNNIVPTKDTILADLGELDPVIYTWYARATLAPGQPYERPNGDGSFILTWPSKQFDYSGTPPTVTVYGWFIVTTVAGPPAVDTLRLCGLLDAPVAMANTMDSCIAQAQLVWPIPQFSAT